MNSAIPFALLLPMALILAQPAVASDAGELTAVKAAIGHPSKPVYSPLASRDFTTRPLFGDTHLHTALSMDAGVSGTRLNAVRSACASGRG